MLNLIGLVVKRLLENDCPLIPKDIKSYIEPFGGGAWCSYFIKKMGRFRNI